jgi:hypothetical protein
MKEVPRLGMPVVIEDALCERKIVGAKDYELI